MTWGSPSGRLSGKRPPARCPGTPVSAGSSLLCSPRCWGRGADSGVRVLGLSCPFYEEEILDQGAGRRAPRMEQGSRALAAPKGSVLSHGQVIPQRSGKRARAPDVRVSGGPRSHSGA